jgi:hypothetical protein
MDNSNNQIPSYKDEFKHSVDLFERSFQAYQDSKMDNQKLVFKDVMDRASNVMEETAPKCLSASGQKKLQTLQEHYQAFLTNPNSQISQAIQNDINNLKNT